MGLEVGIVIIGCIFISLGCVSFTTVGLGSILLSKSNKVEIIQYKKIFLINILFGIIYYIFFIDHSQLIIAEASEKIINNFPGETLGDKRYAYEQTIYIQQLLNYLQIFFKLVITIIFPSLIAISISKYFNHWQLFVFLCIISFGLIFPLDMFIMPLNILSDDNLNIIKILMNSYCYIIAISTVVLISSITLKKIHSRNINNHTNDINNTRIYINKKLISTGMIFTFLGWCGLNFIMYTNVIHIAVAIVLISYHFWFYLNKKFNHSNRDSYYLGAIIGTIGIPPTLLYFGFMFNLLMILTTSIIIFLIFKFIEKKVTLAFNTKFFATLFSCTVLVNIYLFLVFDMLAVLSVKEKMSFNALDYLVKTIGIVFWSGVISIIGIWICTKFIKYKTA